MAGVKPHRLNDHEDVSIRDRGGVALMRTWRRGVRERSGRHRESRNPEIR